MLTNRTFSTLQIRFLIARGVISRKYTKDASFSVDEQEKQTTKTKTTENKQQGSDETNQEESAANRLNRLLASMHTEEKFSLSTKLNMAKPGQSHKKLKEEAKEAAAKKDVFEAAKRVASFLGHDNKQQTESELLTKLLQHKRGLPGSRTEENDLAIERSKTPKSQEDSELSLSELIVKMKVDRNPQPPEESRADFVRRALANQRTQYKKTEYRRGTSDREFPRPAATYTGSVNLFGGEPLGIFKNVTQFKESNDLLPTWSHLQQRELQLQVARPPSNYFEKLMQWTERGKIWRFPINNEQDISEDEAKEDFSDHIFLEQHLEGWCPTKGPIRHFMELVCVGLSKNPYITAKDKKEHILWFRDYFESKKQMLKDLMSQDKLDQISTGKSEVLSN